MLRDVTERKQMEDELTVLNRLLTQLAATDGLTGLTNRRTFDAFLRREYEACEEISVLLFDIDHFKGYNDTYGHQAGDRCLQAVAKVIGDATSNTPGLSARYGGEEFAVVLPNTSEQGAVKVAEAIRLTVRALGLPHTTASRGYVTISAGVATRNPLDARRGRAGWRGGRRPLRSQAFRPEPQRRLLVAGTAICRHRIDPARSAVFCRRATAPSAIFCRYVRQFTLTTSLLRYAKTRLGWARKHGGRK